MNYISKDEFITHTSYILKSGEYCFNNCYNKSNLNSFKKCYLKCESVQIKKKEIMQHYLNQINNIIEGKPNQVSLDNTQRAEKIADKYIFKEFYYQSVVDMGEEDSKKNKSVGSLFGRNK